MEWIFEGIGTTLISFLFGSLTGGIIGYKIGIKNKIAQRQKGKDNANQVQIGNIIRNDTTKGR